jgi:hypothetical protein
MKRLWRPAALLAGLWLIAWVGAALLHRAPLRWIAREGPGTLCYLAVVLTIGLARPVRAWLAGLPTPHRGLLGGLVLLLLIGHMGGRSRWTFPFSEWAMYGRAPRETDSVLEFHGCRGTQASGRMIRIGPEELVPSLWSLSLMTKTGHVALAAFAPAPPAQQRRQRDALSDWLRAIGTLHNRLRPAEAVREIEIVRYTIDARAPGRPRVTEQPLWRVELEPPPS